VQLNVRHPGERFVIRHEDDWPISRTRWTKFHLASGAHTLTTEPPTGSATVTFDALGDGVTFLTEPMREATEITGPVAAKLNISSSTADADIFLVLRVFAPDMKEIVFQGALDPHTPIGQGWLRASHRKLDKKLTLPFRPYHTHDEKQPLKPGQVYELDIEIVPTCIVVPKGCRVGLSVRGRDYVYPGGSGGKLSNMKNEFTGCGPFLRRQDHDPSRRRTGQFLAAADHSRSTKGEAADTEGGEADQTQRAFCQVDTPPLSRLKRTPWLCRYNPSRAIIGAA